MATWAMSPCMRVSSSQCSVAACSSRWQPARTFERVAPKRRALRSARRYVAGETLEDAVATARALHDAGFQAGVDLFGECGRPEDAGAVAREYERLCEAIEPVPDAWVSI